MSMIVMRTVLCKVAIALQGDRVVRNGIAGPAPDFADTLTDVHLASIVSQKQGG
jgi:hypothetical protein